MTTVLQRGVRGREVPIEYRIEQSEGLVVTTADGPIEDGELVRHAEALAADERTRSFDELVLVRTDQILVSPAALWRIGSFLRELPHRENSRLAFVVPSAAVYGMARIFAAVREREELTIRVFREEAQARAWLAAGGTSSTSRAAAVRRD